MSAVPSDVAPGPILPAALRRFRLAPAEGWLTLGFVILMALTVAWSLDDAAWVLGRREWGDFYAWGTLLGALIGFGGAKAGWPRWSVHLVGAVAAALLLPLMVGSVLAGDAGGSPGTLYRLTAEELVKAWTDLGVLKQSVTSATGHHLLAIGIVCWSAGQFAAYGVFGHRRPLDAVIVIGVLLLGNMAVTSLDQLNYLVIFSLAALCVLARTHAFDEQTTWVRRRIGDPAAVRSLYLRGGAVFITAAIFGSLVLTASASSAPLARFWRGFDKVLMDWGRNIQAFLPVGGNSRPGGFGFGDRAVISGIWESRDDPALTIRVPAGDEEKYYWRAVTYDRYEYAAWTWTSPQDINRRAEQRVFEGFAEDPTTVYARRNVTFQVQLENSVGSFIFSPLDPLVLDAESRLKIVGGQGWFAGVETDAEQYTVTAAVPVLGDEDDNGLTANRLRFAGTAYPDEIKRLYLQKPGDWSLGPDSRTLLAQFAADAPQSAYDLAAEMEQRFSRIGEFEYDSDITGLCGDLNTVDCFARYKRGHCMQYATTMAMLLREAGVPARMALGYLPGTRDEATGVERITVGGAHAWVEVFFPGFGWYAFDPTGGGRSQTPNLPAGPQVTPAPSVLPTFGSIRDIPRGTENVNQGGSGTPNNPNGLNNGNTSPAMLIAIAVLLLVVVGAVAFVAWQRGPRGEMTPDAVWRSIGRTAARFGFGPRPQQTVYEYAGVLGDVLPGHRPELQTVARAKVEVAYGRRELGADAAASLRAAQRRLRVGLLRLLLRRRERPRR